MILRQINAIVDPSGYVYDSETNERLKGVTATAYWIPYDETNVNFWNEKPSDQAYGEKWVASDYEQENPLLTNVDGKYAWAVPEGWWRVKYEKEGYVTTWSEWMTVPPEQTDINIGMTPNNVEYAFQITASDTSCATVSLTNNSGKSADVEYIVAAYCAGRMISCRAVSTAVTNGGTIVLTVSFTTDKPVMIKAFALNSTTEKPLRPALEREL